MSLLADSPSSLTYSISSSSPRKRTFSFSLPPTRSEYEPPSKIARMQTAALHYHAFANASSLAGTSRATKGAGISAATSTSATTTTTGIVTPGTDGVPYHRSLKYYKDQRERRRALLQRTPSSPPLLTTPPPPISTPSASPTATITAPSSPSPKGKSGPGAVPMTPSRPRTSSPLAPTPTPLAPRASFPRSRAPPDLHKQAVVARMRTSPAGQQILRMGPRLAVSMLAATQELERMVAREQEREMERQRLRTRQGDGDSWRAGRFPEDVVMREMEEENEVSVSLFPPALSKSWVIVPGEDWEMVDCAA